MFVLLESIKVLVITIVFDVATLFEITAFAVSVATDTFWLTSSSALDLLLDFFADNLNVSTIYAIAVKPDVKIIIIKKLSR